MPIRLVHVVRVVTAAASPRDGVRIGHHRGAVEMAQAEFDNGVNTGAVTMAHNIVTTQQAEIDQMTTMLGG
jgi:uncharacterized protein (DUF305 family)